MFNEALRQWIYKVVGLSITQQNQAPVELAVRILSDQLNMAPQDYVNKLLSNQVPAQPFVDEITTNESYFFRAEEQMRYCIDVVIPHLLKVRQQKKVRILSLPCARGEEPCSLAMMIRDAGLPADRIEIIGADISARCLADARNGVYTPLSLRRTGDVSRQRWFRVGKNSVRLDPSISRMVQFRQYNLMHDNWTTLGGSFDIVFCENVLIYFDRQTIRRVLNTIKQLMSVDAWLFVDHAEWSLPGEVFHLHNINGVTGFKLSPPENSKSYKPKADIQKIPAFKQPLTTAQNQPQRLSLRVKKPLQTAEKNDVAQAIENAYRFYEKQQFIKALEAFHKLERRGLSGRQLCQVLVGKAHILADCGEDLEAMEVCEQVIAIEGGHNDQHLAAAALLAMLFNKKGILSQADFYLQKVRELDDQHPVLKLR